MHGGFGLGRIRTVKTETHERCKRKIEESELDDRENRERTYRPHDCTPMIREFQDAFNTQDYDQLLRSICDIGHFFATFSPDEASMQLIKHSDFIAIICQTFTAEENVAILEESVWATNLIITQGRRDEDRRLVDPLVDGVWTLVLPLGDRVTPGRFHRFLALVGTLCQVRSDARDLFFGALSGHVEGWLLGDDNPGVQVAAAHLLVSFVWQDHFDRMPGFEDFFAWMVRFFLERDQNVSANVLTNLLEAFKWTCHWHPRFIDQLAKCVFQSALESILTDREQQPIVQLALELTLAFVKRDADTIRFDPALLLARGASRDVATATLAFDVIGKLVAKRDTAIAEYTEDAPLKMIDAALGAAPFAIKMAITRCLRVLIYKASVADQDRIAAHGFIPHFVEMLESLDGSDDRLEVLRSLMYFCEAGEPVQNGENRFRKKIAEVGGIDLLLDLRVNGRDQERTAVEHLLKVLGIGDDDEKDPAGSDIWRYDG
jgi:hypothetical protein